MQYKNIEQYRRVMQGLIGSGPETQVFWQALDFALEAHGEQWRRSGDPYIMHPCNVARILAEELDIRDAEILAAALLHDTVEDVSYVTPALIKDKFGGNVEAIVEGCTKLTHFSGSKQTFKKMVHRKIFSGAAAKPEVMLVKLADRLHNLRTLSSMPRHKRQKVADETLDIYAPLATILGLFAIKREMYNLALAYKFPRQGSRLRQHINKLKQDSRALKIVEQLRAAFAFEGVDGRVSLRTKGLWGYYDARHRILIKEIESPQEILIVVADRKSCYEALGTLNRIYPPIPRTIRDFIANPKPTGYQGLHARANIEGKKYLFKIRTEEMALRAQRGLVRYWSGDAKKRGRFVKNLQEMFDILGSDEAVSYRDMIAASGRKEIYTYTPQGDLICLPVNSIALDFAFSVHTAIGQTCIAAMIGNRRVAPDHVLSDGDVIKIIRQSKPVNFDPDIQQKCQTPRARSELVKMFRSRRKEVTERIGESVLHQEMKRYGLPFEIIQKDEMGDVLEYFGIESLGELYLQVGMGKIRLRELIYEIRTGLFAGQEILQSPTGVFNRVELSTIDPVVVKSSACCKPTPLDKGIFGLLSERGLSLHHKDCAQLQKIKFQREEAVDVRWDLKNTMVAKPQKVVIFAANRQRLFMLLSVAPSEMKIVDIIALTHRPTTTPAWEVNFTVPNLYALKKIFKHLERSELPYEFMLEQ
ncbi:MAG TPA: bifunctional (p)ppGpp synthetase/guanosine-3',5'-bis(diphosphate) 3'-pyrophosphohydrolase [Desulfobacteraceae bacterium]|nr:bifunctional (p)ppGpp synthetase/guanosine-3',5'-bis(diphosphate) 3'-pyrophosphohydrolase [Desulfobacteraceae bacterium]